jgi:hypothetical protein
MNFTNKESTINKKAKNLKERNKSIKMFLLKNQEEMEMDQSL